MATSIMLAMAFSASPAWVHAASAAAAQGQNDEIVKMREEIAAARKEYKRKVGEAQKVFDEQKSAAAKERDTAISAARAKAGQK
ncbi:hypothetical protein AB4Z48_13015 [Cupriavidus sp. 2TAF22]|uniref:hypothetical protein n=1 Tax=unclassified Cupriavidus TaxID=2640874 RepID=UPI003F90479E